MEHSVREVDGADPSTQRVDDVDSRERDTGSRRKAEGRGGRVLLAHSGRGERRPDGCREETDRPHEPVVDLLAAHRLEAPAMDNGPHAGRDVVRPLQDEGTS